MAGGPVTVLFTDLVSSTELLQRVGDEQAQRVFQTHRRLLRDAVTMHGGQEVKWTGDGLMTTFASSADAVRCAVTMQQTTRARAAGERLAMRAGLHVGEVLPDEGDWVGAAVVVAQRLCDRATAGQILCSGLMVELLGGRRAFRFGDVGALDLKGFAAPVAAYEVHYERDDPAAVLRHTPFTGRAAELSRLERRLEEARGGRGGVAMLVGEPGIGKTRTLEELAETARAQEALVLWGRCYEGEAGRPYGPFVEAIAEYSRKADTERLRADLGPGAAPLARLVPVLCERLPDLPEPVPLQPDEERTRLIDAVTQFLLALAARTLTVLVLDDLHWADAGTVTLLRHVGRFAPRGRLLVVGAYRDVELGRAHPLADVLGVLPRETTYDQVALAGLELAAVEELLEAVADQRVAQRLVATITREASGNPFFIRAVLLHLLEEGLLAPDGASWKLAVNLDGIGLPDTVRQVIERRLGECQRRRCGCSGSRRRSQAGSTSRWRAG
jgi:class 3 adenylate cyclase